DVDDDRGRLLVEHVFYEALLKVRYLVPADPGADDFDAEVFVLFRDRVLDDGDVALRTDTGLRDRGTEEDDLVALLECRFVGTSNGRRAEGGCGQQCSDSSHVSSVRGSDTTSKIP